MPCYEYVKLRFPVWAIGALPAPPIVDMMWRPQLWAHWRSQLNSKVGWTNDDNRIKFFARISATQREQRKRYSITLSIKLLLCGSIKGGRGVEQRKNDHHKRAMLRSKISSGWTSYIIPTAKSRAGLDIIWAMLPTWDNIGAHVMLVIHVNNGYIFRLCNIKISGLISRDLLIRSIHVTEPRKWPNLGLSGT